MSDESTTPDWVKLVRRSNEAWNRRDVDEWLAFFSPDIVLCPISTFPDSQERRGLDAMRRWWDEWNDVWGDDFTAEAESIREYGDAVIALIN
jgi:ketosteroid isomerase-like protein